VGGATESRSYGFRPGRGCHDAIGAIFQVAKGANPARQWVLDADLTAAFDRIDHHRLLDTIGEFPARERIAGWLKAGVVENGLFAATGAGTPQGGVISPLLLNVALHGMEHAAGARYDRLGPRAAAARRNSPVLIRYADDLVALCHSRQQAEQITAQLVAWLRPRARGLALNEDKTRIACLDEGFDFLGFTVRRYRGTLLITPSKQAVRRIRGRLRIEMRSLRGTNAAAVIARLNPIIGGWAAYYRNVVSSKVFTDLDHYMWQLTYKWARHTHPNKPTRWIVRRYFGAFNKSRRDRWVFGDRVSGAYLLKFAWTRIVRHQMVTGTASPDDPILTDHWKPAAQGNTATHRRHQAAAATRPSMAVARDADSCSCTPTTRHKPQPNGRCGWRPPARRSPRTPSPYGNGHRIHPTSVTSTHAAVHGSPAHHQPAIGLLEPDAWKSCTSGSEGGRAQQCARPIRHDRTRVRAFRPHVGRPHYGSPASAGSASVAHAHRHRLRSQTSIL
jgi:group II intron reverse transcriptase/maturase